MANFLMYVGVALASSGKRPTVFTVLDARGHSLAIGSGTLADALAYAAGASSALLALTPPVRARAPRHVDSAGEPPPLLPESPEEKVPPLIATLQRLGYALCEDESDAPRQWLETDAETVFEKWLGHPPLPGNTLEGRIQRQLILADMDCDVPDAMEFFEEITRFKLLRGQLPYDKILSLAELNAYAAATLARLYVQSPERVQRLYPSFILPL